MRQLTDLTASLAPLPLGRRLTGLLTGWRGLARFWATLLVFVLLLAGILQTLGPSLKRAAPGTDPHAAPAGQPDPRHADPHNLGHDPLGKKSFEGGPRTPIVPGRSSLAGPIADPDPALLEPYAAAPNQKLPRVAADGRTPMSLYAAAFDPAIKRPRVGILIAGIGLSETDSLTAIKTLPGPVTLAISPYASDLARLLAAARMTNHEYLLSVPMEPQGYPVNDPDDRYALMTSVSPTDNLSRLQAILARFTGYVGVTNALGQMRGERLSGMVDQFDVVLEEVGHRGLLFLDARPNEPALPYAWNRSADIILDTGEITATILDQRLDALTHLALDKGTALAIVSIPRPLTVDRVAAWTNSLTAKGLVLAPVSALVRQPAKQDFDK